MVGGVSLQLLALASRWYGRCCQSNWSHATSIALSPHFAYLFVALAEAAVDCVESCKEPGREADTAGWSFGTARGDNTRLVSTERQRNKIIQLTLLLQAPGPSIIILHP